MLVLALDTSSAATSVALVTVASADGQITSLATDRNIDARAHGEVLTPLIEAALAEAGRQVTDIEAIVAGLGPGPFTGLRVGLVTAAVLANARQIPVYGVCSLDGIGAAYPGERVLVAADARRREVYWAGYTAGIRDGDPQVAKPDAVPTGDYVAAAGAGARLYAEVLGLPVRDHDYPDPVLLVAGAAARIREHGPSELLTPLYLRRPDAVEPGPRKPVRL